MILFVTQTLKIVVIGAMAVIVALGGQRFFDYYSGQGAPADLGQRVSFAIKDEDTTEGVAKRLHDAGLIKYELYFQMRMRMSGDELKQGTYTLRKGMSVPTIIKTISGEGGGLGDEKDVAAAVDVTLTTIEGWRTEQIADEIDKGALAGGGAAFLDATRKIDPSGYDFLQDRPAEATLEGYLFPDTYTVKSDTPAEDVVYRMLDNFEQRFTPEMRQQAADQGLTIYQVLTMASIVEREAQQADERPIVASVYFNRINAGMPLQADPTVQYPLGNESEWWPKLQPNQPDEVESPYNTYRNSGWPPGPICNPSLASIQAALEPAATDFLYFVAKGDGTHAFTADLAEHEQNIAVYLNGESAAAAEGGGEAVGGAYPAEVPVEGAAVGGGYAEEVPAEIETGP